MQSGKRPSFAGGQSTQSDAHPPPAIAHLQPAPPSAPNREPQPNLPAGGLDVKVRIKSPAGGWSTVNLATAIRDALDAFARSGLIFECPTQMRVGSTYQVRLTIKQNLDDLLRQKLQDLGIPAEYLKGIMTLAVADLLPPPDSSLSILPGDSAAGHPSDAWVWRVEARQAGDHKLELRVTLSARSPARGEVRANAALLSRTVTVDADPLYEYGNFLDRYWLEMAGSLAAVLAAWLIWIYWRTRRTTFSHR